MRRHDLIVLCHKDKVGSAGFLHFRAGRGIQIHIFIKSVCMGSHNGMQAHGIVQSRLDVAGPVRRRAVKVGYADSDRLCAALEIRTYRRRKYAELIFISRLHADNRVNTEHVRPDIKRRAGAVRRNIRRIRLHRLHDRIHKAVLRKCRHFKPFRRIHHAGRVQVRAECHDASVLSGIRFHAFKYSLRILEHARTLIHHNIGVVRQAALIPFAVFIICHIPLVRLNIAEPEVFPVYVLLLHCDSSSAWKDP